MTTRNNGLIRILALGACGASMISVVGCASVETKKPDAEGMADDGPLAELRMIAVEARDELRLLAKTRDATATPSMSQYQHQQKSFQALAIPPGFNEPVTLNFQGNAENAAQAIAGLAGYELRVLGNKSRTDVVVKIDIEDLPLNEALRELGSQTGDSVMVEIYADKKLMQLVYQDQF